MSMYMSMCMSVYMSAYMSAYMSVYMSVYMSAYMSLYMSVYMSPYMSMYMSVCTSVYTSVYMSMYMSMYMYMLYELYIMMRLGTMKCGHHKATFVMSRIRNFSVSLLKRLHFEYSTFFSNESTVCHSSILGLFGVSPSAVT